MIQPRPYQQDIINQCFDKLENSILIQSATGSGKTVIMAFLVKRYLKENPNNKILISVHREELVTQTIETLASIGILSEIIIAKNKNISDSNVYVGMTQTIWSRKYNLDIDLLIIDECHDQTHAKTFDLFPNAKRIGFTATPCINKRITYYKCTYCGKEHDSMNICCYNEKVHKWSKPVTLSEQYKDIIVGIEIEELINQGSLVQDICFSYDFYKDLKPKGNDDFDENQIAEISAKHDENVLQEYKEKAFGKKTMIFTASTKQNITLLETFKDYPVKSYDSVNNDKTQRTDIVDWFKDTEGAILISTGTFTTGFDVKEVECIIINRPTTSLSLWLQIVGRGARPTDKIFKDSFLVIDLGGNIQRLGKWSDKIDWKDIFFNGVVKEKKQKHQLIQCEKCDYVFVGYSNSECEGCGHVNQGVTVQKELKEGSREFNSEYVQETTKRISVIPLPNGKKISDYVKRTTDSKNDYYKIMIDKYIDLWKYNKVDVSIYEGRKQNGKLKQRVHEYFQKNYYYCNHLNNGVPRTYKYLVNKTLKKLADIYENGRMST